MAVQDSESYHKGLRLMFSGKDVVMERFFKLKDNQTTWQREIFGGLTTFMTMAFGFISYTLLKTVKGQFKEVPALISIFAVLFVLRYILLT